MCSDPTFPCGPILNETAIRAGSPTNMCSAFPFDQCEMYDGNANAGISRSRWVSRNSSIYDAPSEYLCSHRSAPHLPKAAIKAPPLGIMRNDYRWNVMRDATARMATIGGPKDRGEVDFSTYTVAPCSRNVRGFAQNRRGGYEKREESDRMAKFEDNHVNAMKKRPADVKLEKLPQWVSGSDSRGSGMPPTIRMVRPRNAIDVRPTYNAWGRSERAAKCD